MLDDIITPRLILRHLSEKFIDACLVDDLEEASAVLGLQVPEELLEDKALMVMRLTQYRDAPEYAPWSLRAIGLRSSGVVIGQIGFHDQPNVEELRQYSDNGVEVGYAVYPDHRRQGYIEEAARGLFAWALDQSQTPLQHFIASIAPDNEASQSLIRKLGFRKVGERMDDVDGLEEVFLADAETFRSTPPPE